MIRGNRLIILLIRLNGSRNRLNAFDDRFPSVCLPFFQTVERISVSVRFPKTGHKRKKRNGFAKYEIHKQIITEYI
jgi:hypothetical protein